MCSHSIRWNRAAATRWPSPLDGVTDTLNFTTAEESFFVDASRYGLVADGVTDNTAKLQAALSTCPAGWHGLRARRHLPHPKPVFCRAARRCISKRAARCWAAPTALTTPFCPVFSPAITRRDEHLPRSVGGQPAGQLCGSYQRHQRRERDDHRRGARLTPTPRTATGTRTRRKRIFPGVRACSSPAVPKTSCCTAFRSATAIPGPSTRPTPRMWTS